MVHGFAPKNSSRRFGTPKFASKTALFCIHEGAASYADSQHDTTADEQQVCIANQVTAAPYTRTDATTNRQFHAESPTSCQHNMTHARGTMDTHEFRRAQLCQDAQVQNQSVQFSTVDQALQFAAASAKLREQLAQMVLNVNTAAVEHSQQRMQAPPALTEQHVWKANAERRQFNSTPLCRNISLDSLCPSQFSDHSTRSPSSGAASSGSESSDSPRSYAESDRKASKEPNSPISSAMENSRQTSFRLTLRRMQGHPLGLVTIPDDETASLSVEVVRPGSVAASWNAMNMGELREIRPGDRIVEVNGMREPYAMLAECGNNLLLKMIFERV